MTDPHPPEVELPKLQDDAELAAVRDELRRVDVDIIRLLADRVRLAVAASGIKRARGEPVRDPAQETVVLRRAITLGEERGLDAAGVARVYDAVLQLARDAQQRAAGER